MALGLDRQGIPRSSLYISSASNISCWNQGGAGCPGGVGMTNGILYLSVGQAVSRWGVYVSW
jgi:hypothetical protein